MALNVDLMRGKPLLGPLKRDDAKELQKAVKAAGIKNPNYWNFNSSLMYIIKENNCVDVESRARYPEYITFEDLCMENCGDYQFENEIMALFGG